MKTKSVDQESLPFQEDPWLGLQKWTDARIALGRAGTALPTSPLLEFQLAHARARDAVQTPCGFSSVRQSAARLKMEVLEVRSRAAHRAEYLRRPDFGRQLDSPSEALLKSQVPIPGGFDVCLIIADGLSSQAVETQAGPMLEVLVPLIRAKRYSLAPLICATQARVALSDEVGEALDAALCLMLVGERPGLSSPDSLGAYLTWNPHRGLQNADRNCVSNIRPAGLNFESAAQTLMNLIRGAFLLRVSGVKLKEDSYLEAPPDRDRLD